MKKLFETIGLMFFPRNHNNCAFIEYYLNSIISLQNLEVKSLREYIRLLKEEIEDLKEKRYTGVTHANNMLRQENDRLRKIIIDSGCNPDK